MQLNTAQFLATLRSAGGSLTVDTGVITLANGDTFDVSRNVDALETLLGSAASALKDAAEELGRCGVSQTYPATRGRLMEFREQLAGHPPSINTVVLTNSGSKEDLAAIAAVLRG